MRPVTSSDLSIELYFRLLKSRFLLMKFNYYCKRFCITTSYTVIFNHHLGVTLMAFNEFQNMRSITKSISNENM